MLEFEIIYSESEWQMISEELKKLGFSDARSYINNKSLTLLIPDRDPVREKRLRKAFCIADEEVYMRIRNYCIQNRFPPATLIKRLITEPLLRSRLLEEVSGSR